LHKGASDLARHAHVAVAAALKGTRGDLGMDDDYSRARDDFIVQAARLLD
jgi:hypothetical protein